MDELIAMGVMVILSVVGMLAYIYLKTPCKKLKYASAPLENRLVINKLFEMKERYVFFELFGRRIGSNEDEIFEASCQIASKAADIKDAIHAGKAPEALAYFCILSALCDAVMYGNDFVYRGVPGMISQGNIASFNKVLEIMKNKGFITPEEYSTMDSNFRENVKTLG